MAKKGKIKDRRRVGDHYARKAKQDHYAARSVYKLQEIDAKHRLLRPGGRVLDLGCAPGSWTQFASEKVGPSGRVVGVDQNPVQIGSLANVAVLTADVFELSAEALLSEGRFDVVLSDLAPKTTGSKVTDQARSAELVRRAFDVARRVLRPGGAFVFKVFEGPDVKELIEGLGGSFRTVSRVKPKSSRSYSPEIFGVAVGFRPDGD
jgi:23S rRNA (uridine2552-2'-O)-methyltransferase